MIVAVHLDAFDVFPSRLISVFQVFPFFELRFEIPDVTTKGFFAHFSMTGIVVQPNTAVTLPGIPFPLMGCLLFSGVVGFLVAFVVRIGIEGPMGLGIAFCTKKHRRSTGKKLKGFMLANFIGKINTSYVRFPTRAYLIRHVMLATGKNLLNFKF